MAGWLPLLILLFVLALVVGPVMWMKPSARDRRLAAMRARAAASGLAVQMQALPAALGQGTAAVYSSRWGDGRRLQLGWILELQRVEHELHFAGRWDWRNGRPAAPKSAWEPLRQMLKNLPEDACAVIAQENGLGIQWRESSGDAGFHALEAALAEFRPPIEEAIRQAAPAQPGDA
ncbi:hypothetical protein SAMN05660479_00749 [Microbulbifer thermotolerans]|uniref:Uncharacterized protein n=2 Tax=Microbulbifer thermotolerans TaxID=252514 RepID=A0A143HMA1_MICTH|nr:hypothetical protein A3224_08675 [Microbulbifer thermotolerans]SFB88979.1 hypothetical protein SAMN05660479_00749 [Microbulbifer thermotolerans]